MHAKAARQQAVSRDQHHTLFPPDIVRNEVDDWLTAELLQAAHAVRQGPVGTPAPIDQFRAALADLAFDTPRDIRDVLGWVLPHMQSGMVHVAHPRYYGLFNPTPSFPAQCAERIVASFNPQLASAKTSPFPVALEAHLVGAIAQRAGMPEGAAGHFTTGGSEANFTAMLCALTRANPAFASEGVAAFSAKPALYVSKDAHLAWLKIAHQCGIGRNAVRLVATDGTGRLDAGALAAAIEADRQSGFFPAMVVATAGTTGAGMIDPLEKCREISASVGAWYHVDAAWGGALICSDRFRPLLQGIGRADSITIDAHKWLATTMGCGIFLTPWQTVLSDTFQATMDCMPSNFAGIDPYVTTVQWSRRFLGLRLFVALATAGWRGYADHVEKAIGLADLLKQKLVADGWGVANDSPVAVVCLRPPSGAADARQIAKSVVEEGGAWISSVEFEGAQVVRVCITSGETTQDDILQLVDLLRSKKDVLF
jgi:glutamate/tyrosine decarboxylase-like PLP-dependent enzyme